MAFVPDIGWGDSKRDGIRFMRQSAGRGIHLGSADEDRRPAAVHERRLDALAEVAVKAGLGLAAGQELIVTAPCAALPLVRRIAEHAYKAGAVYVHHFFTDDEMTLMRYRHANEAAFDFAPEWLFDGLANALANGAARLTVVGGDPELLAGEDPAKVARARHASAKASRPIMELLAGVATNWTTVAFATPSWAKAIFPDAPADAAVARLWEEIFLAARSDGPDPVERWRAHARDLEARAKFLSNKRYATLRFVGPGTDLRIGLADGHLWQGGLALSKTGLVCSPNIPSEEVFTTPHRDRVEGHVTFTRPLCLQGSLIEGASITFSTGEVVEANARVGEDLLRRLLTADEGARRLGEVGLVPNSSPVSKSGLFFYNTLFDENAGSHVALGQAFDKCIDGGDRMDRDDLLAHGANRSAVHIDCVIGSAHMDVEAVTADGRRERVMEGGEWVSSAA